MFIAMQLYVPMSTAMLRLLWLVQIGKGVFSLQWPLQLGRDQRVELVLGVAGERMSLGATVRSCRPDGVAYQVELRLDPLPDSTRAAIESVAVP